MTKPAKKPARVPNKVSGRQRPVPFKDVVQKLLETPPEALRKAPPKTR